MVKSDKIYVYTQIITIMVLVAVIYVGLLPALLSGLLVYQLIDYGARGLERIGVKAVTGKIILVFLLAMIVIAGFALAVSVFASYVSDGPESFVNLLRRMADVVSTGKAYLPLWAQGYLPTSMEEWQALASEWLRENAAHFSILGQEAGMVLIHLLFGMIIGGLVAINPGFQKIRGPLAQAISDRIGFLVTAFRRIVFSQIRISALNTFLTAIFLAIVLPMTGNPLPMTKTMIAVTFVAGLLPIVGNLISNTVIFLISLSVSPVVAVASLTFLIIIHKLEYFVNAHIIGSQIRARAWELLGAMLVMESVFGIAGLVAAPIYYAYIKDELKAQKLV